MRMGQWNFRQCNPMVLAAFFCGIVLAAKPLKAQDLGINLWGMEFATVGDDGVNHMGIYPGVSLSLTYETAGWAFSPSVGVEWAADGEFWGFMAMLYADRPLNEHLGFDMIFAGMHDQVGSEWSDAEYFVGAGLGLTWFVNNRVAVTPNMLVYYGLRTSTWALAPGVNVWVSLDGD